MSFLAYYAIFALATGIVVCYEHLAPVIRFRERKARVDNKLITYLVVFVFSTIVAPLVLLSCIIPSFSLRFKQGLHEGLFK